jgi:hypothetical protein
MDIGTISILIVAAMAGMLFIGVPLAFATGSIFSSSAAARRSSWDLSSWLRCRCSC